MISISNITLLCIFTISCSVLSCSVVTCPPATSLLLWQVPRLSDAAIGALVAACAATVDTSTAYTNHDIDEGEKGGEGGSATTPAVSATAASNCIASVSTNASINASGNASNGGMTNVATMYTSRADQRNVTLPLETIVTIASRCSDNQERLVRALGQLAASFLPAVAAQLAKVLAVADLEAEALRALSHAGDAQGPGLGPGPGLGSEKGLAQKTTASAGLQPPPPDGEIKLLSSLKLLAVCAGAMTRAGTSASSGSSAVLGLPSTNVMTVSATTGVVPSAGISIGEKVGGGVCADTTATAGGANAANAAAAKARVHALVAETTSQLMAQSVDIWTALDECMDRLRALEDGHYATATANALASSSSSSQTPSHLNNNNNNNNNSGSGGKHPTSKLSLSTPSSTSTTSPTQPSSGPSPSLSAGGKSSSTVAMQAMLKKPVYTFSPLSSRMVSQNDPFSLSIPHLHSYPHHSRFHIFALCSIIIVRYQHMLCYDSIVTL